MVSWQLFFHENSEVVGIVAHFIYLILVTKLLPKDFPFSAMLFTGQIKIFYIEIKFQEYVQNVIRDRFFIERESTVSEKRLLSYKECTYHY